MWEGDIINENIPLILKHAHTRILLRVVKMFASISSLNSIISIFERLMTCVGEGRMEK